MDPERFDWVFDREQREEIEGLLDMTTSVQTPDAVRKTPDTLQEINILISGWGGPRLDQDFLEKAPNLKAVFYSAGSLKRIVTPEFWTRNIPITSSWVANAVPVAEFTLAAITLSLKQFWRHSGQIPVKHQLSWSQRQTEIAGAYKSVVGLISLGQIGQMLAKKLQEMDVRLIGYDPYVDLAIAKNLNIELMSLEEVFRNADVVSLHTPLLPETVGLIQGAHFRAMKANASFINTARGQIIRTAEMIEVLQERPDLMALLDVTAPEPLNADSPLLSLPNVIITPHIAGSLGRECHRLADYVIQDLKRFLKGMPLQWQITEEKSALMA